MHQGHVAALELKHAEVESRLSEEMGRPAPDQSVVQTLKRRKLSLKDSREREMARNL